MMRVCFVSAWFDDDAPDARAALDSMPTVRSMAREQRRLGHAVAVVQLFRHSGAWEEDEVEYRLVTAPPGMAAAARIATMTMGGQRRVRYMAAPSLAREIAAFRPDVVHAFGLTLDVNLALVARAASRLGAPLVAEFHGGAPARRVAHRALQRHNLRRAARVLFTTADHAAPWIEAGVVRREQVAALVETSSDFRMRPRADARRETGMTGDPVLLWTGRLHPLKDPLTALRGVELVMRDWPEARLYMHFRSTELLPEIRRFLATRPALAARVHLGGALPHEQLEAIYNSADIFVQASRHEVAGIAVLEALACGVLPVVSDIPSFRVMTRNGLHGGLFAPGDAVGLAAALRRIDLARLPELASAARDHFDAELSFAAQARRLADIYCAAMEGQDGLCASP